MDNFPRRYLFGNYAINPSFTGILVFQIKPYKM